MASLITKLATAAATGAVNSFNYLFYDVAGDGSKVANIHALIDSTGNVVNPAAQGTDPSNPPVANLGAGISGWLATIAAKLGSLLTVNTSAETARNIVIPARTVSAIPTTPGSGWAPGDTVTLATAAASDAQPPVAGTVTTPAVFQVTTTQVGSLPTVAAAGTGGATGNATVTGSTGAGTRFQASVVIANGGITSVTSLTVAGAYTVNPTNLAAEPVTGGGLTGATLNLTMGILALTQTTAGTYTLTPSGGNVFPQGVASGAGINASLSVTMASVSTQLAPAVALRRGWRYQPQGQSIYLTTALAAAATNSTCLKIPADYPMDNEPGHVSTGAIYGIGSVGLPVPVYGKEF